MKKFVFDFFLYICILYHKNENTMERNYHTSNIQKGTYGEFSKIVEEASEFMDLYDYNKVNILLYCEIADIIGAIKVTSVESILDEMTEVSVSEVFRTLGLKEDLDTDIVILRNYLKKFEGKTEEDINKTPQREIREFCTIIFCVISTFLDECFVVDINDITQLSEATSKALSKNEN